MSKGAAFILGVLLMATFGLLETAFPGRNAHTMGVIGAIGTAIGAYVTLQVANNGVKGKFFNAELYDAENKQEGGKNDGTKQKDA
jgi:hypothetical protein